MILRTLSRAVLSLAASAALASAQTQTLPPVALVLRNATLMTVTHGIIEHGAAPAALSQAVMVDTAQPAPTIAIIGGKLLPVSHGVIENGTLILAAGKIAAVGPAGTAIPKGATIVDATGMTVYPALSTPKLSLAWSKSSPARSAPTESKPAMKSSRRCTSTTLSTPKLNASP